MIILWPSIVPGHTHTQEQRACYKEYNSLCSSFTAECVCTPYNTNLYYSRRLSVEWLNFSWQRVCWVYYSTHFYYISVCFGLLGGYAKRELTFHMSAFSLAFCLRKYCYLLLSHIFHSDFCIRRMYFTITEIYLLYILTGAFLYYYAPGQAVDRRGGGVIIPLPLSVGQ